MKLAYSPASPYVRKVMVLLHETGQLADVEVEEMHTTPTSPDANLLPKSLLWNERKVRRFMTAGSSVPIWMIVRVASFMVLVHGTGTPGRWRQRQTASWMRRF